MKNPKKCKKKIETNSPREKIQNNNKKSLKHSKQNHREKIINKIQKNNK